MSCITHNLHELSSPSYRLTLTSLLTLSSRVCLTHLFFLSCLLRIFLYEFSISSKSVRHFVHIIIVNPGTLLYSCLNFQEPCVLYMGRAYRYPPDVAFYIFFSTTISTEYFKHAALSPFFSSKCRLFHNATFFGSCIIHILHTGCAKI